MRTFRRHVSLLVLAACGWPSATGCAHAPAPVLEPVREAADRAPLIFVPGVTGVILKDRETGKAVWGTGRNLIWPHDRGYATARPIVDRGDAPRVEADRVILELSLFGVIRKRVYRQLVELFEANGYRLGSLDEPSPVDNLFLFAYDWRQDNVESARLLARRLERLRQVRGVDRLDVDLVCQSNGAHVCRYLTKFGALSLEEAEAGRTPVRSGVWVQKLVLVGASNGGSLRVLREMNRGRRYVRAIGRRWSPETLFTFLSLFQDLPAYADELFVDEHGEAMAVDLYDPGSWERFGWGAYGDEARRRLAAGAHAAIFGGESARRDYLATALERARRFHRLLERDAAVFGATRYYLIINSHNETPARAVLMREGDSWRTLFSGDRQLRHRPALHSAVTAAGDGHATLESQLRLSPQERERIVWDPIDIEGEHFEMVLDSRTRLHLLEIVAERENGELR